MLNKQQHNEISKCANDFSYFCANYVKLSVPNIRSKVPFELYPYQVRLYEHIEDNRFAIFSKFRQAGFTTELATYGLWLCLFKLDQKILWLSKNDRDSRDVCDRIIKRIIEDLPDWMKGNVMKMTNSNQKSFPETDSVIHFNTPETAHDKSVSLLIVDEASLIKDMDKHWSALWPSLGSSGKATIFSSVNYDDDWFWQTKEQAKLKNNSFAVYNCHYLERPEFCDPGWQMDAIKNLGQKGFDVQFKQQPLERFQRVSKKRPDRLWRSIWDEWASSSGLDQESLESESSESSESN